MKRTILSIFLASSLSLVLYSQDFEGTILYEVSYLNLSEEIRKMLPDETTQVLFSMKGDKTKMEMEMMGAKMVMISDMKANVMTSYTDVMGQKIKSTNSTENTESIEIEKTDETKKVAGYLCKKVIMKQPEIGSIDVYYAPDLKSSAFLSLQPSFKELKGIPLEYQMSQQGMSMIYTATEVVKKGISDSTFDPPPGDYKEAPALPKY
ncbi:MAG: DUF4412 domain-containing protein [Bacteroidota bacterium]